MKSHVYPEVDTGHTAEKFKQPRLLYWNRGDGQFFDLSAQGGPGITDAHLKSADFFDVEKFPALHFKSESVSIVRNGELAVEGDLTIHGVTHKVRFAVGGPTQSRKDPWGNTRVAVFATTKINRKDFGLTWNAVLETGGILVGDDVTITLDVEFVKA